LIIRNAAGKTANAPVRIAEVEAKAAVATALQAKPVTAAWKLALQKH